MLQQGWGLDLESLESSLAQAKRNGVLPRALVFINPGNPTGNCLTVSDLQQLVRFCYNNRYTAGKMHCCPLPAEIGGCVGTFCSVWLSTVTFRRCVDVRSWLSHAMSGLRMSYAQHPWYPVIPVQEECEQLKSCQRCAAEVRQAGQTIQYHLEKPNRFHSPYFPRASCFLIVGCFLCRRLILMADEVYQENIYQSKTPFTSCKKVRIATHQ